MKKILVLATTCLGIFLCMLDTSVMNIALPAITTGLHTNLNDLQWAINAYMITFASLTIPLSKIAERFGKRRFYLLGLAVFLIGSLISSLAVTLTVLIIGRIIQSFGAALVFPLSMVLGIETETVEKRTTALVLLGMMQGLAASLGPTVGGVLTQFLSWRWIFLINLPFVLLAVLFCLISFDFAGDVKNKKKVDFLGAFISIVALFSLTLAIVEGRSWGWSSLAVLGLFALTFIALTGFILYERRLDDPMIPMVLFKNRQFNGAAVVLILSNLFLLGVTVVLPTYFTKIQGDTELRAALLMTSITGMIFILSPIAGFLIKRISARLLIAVGFLAMTGAYGLFAVISMTNLAQVIGTCMLLGFGYGVVVGPIVVLAASDFTGELLNASQSVAGVLRQIGMVLGVAIFVTGLYSNINQAKIVSISYAKIEIKQLKLPAAQEKKMKQETLSQIQNEKSGTSTAKNHVSEEEKALLIQENFEKVAVKMPNLPAAAKTQILEKITQQVTAKISVINQKINATIAKIIKQTKSEFSKAFIHLYLVAVPFVFLSTFSALLFKRKS